MIILATCRFKRTRGVTKILYSLATQSLIEFVKGLHTVVMGGKIVRSYVLESNYQSLSNLYGENKNLAPPKVLFLLKLSPFFQKSKLLQIKL